MEQSKYTIGNYISDVYSYIQEINSSATGAFSNFLDYVKNEPNAANWSEAERLNKISDYYENTYRDFASVATEYAVKAEATDNPAKAEIWKRTADWCKNIADERQSMSNTAWMQRLDTLNRADFGKVAGAFGIVGDAVDFTQIGSAAIAGDWDRVGEKGFDILGGLCGAALVLSLPFEMPVLLTAGLIGAASYLGSELGEWLWNASGLGELGGWIGRSLYDWINSDENTLFLSAKNWRPHRDPLALDLDGDGIETSAIGGWNGLMFDHNADGVKEGTGWISADDGLLVLDRNGNGTIDSGRELFGDNTELSGGGTAADAFEALADQDSNGDGKIDTSDAVFNDLRVWQDKNQDGISQEDELYTLEELGIKSISTQSEATNTNQNGNTITATGTFEYTDGTTGQSGSLNFAGSNFFTDFTDTIEIPEAYQGLPGMHGYAVAA